MRGPGQVGAQLGGHVSSSTLSAHQMARAGVSSHSSPVVELSDQSLSQHSDLWKDEAGRLWRRSAVLPRRWRLLDNDMDDDMLFWDELG